MKFKWEKFLKSKEPKNKVQNPGSEIIPEANTGLKQDISESAENIVTDEEFNADLEDDLTEKEEITSTEVCTNDKQDDDEKELNFSILLAVIKKNWWVLLLNCVVLGSIAALLIIEEPRTYTTEIRLAPEAEDASGGGTLSSIASSFGINLGDMASVDAIRPDLYPDLVESNDFIVKLFSLPVKTLDGNVYTDYFTYLKKYQKSSWWRKKINDLKRKINKKPVGRDRNTIGNELEQNQNHAKILSYDEEKMIENIKGLVKCSIDQKTYVISISVVDQDPLVCATVADSVRSRIQNFITEYRTKKASKDYEYYYRLLKEAKNEYDKSCAAYAKYVDSHRDVILQAYISERDQLENDMQLKLNTYNAIITQVQQAKAKVQEKTPAFTILQGAYVPVMPTGPKRMLFVLGVVFLTFTFTVFFLLRKFFANNLNA